MFSANSLPAVGVEAGKRRRHLMKQEEESRKTRRGRFWQWTEFGEKSGWEWMQLFIIPLVIGVAGLWFNCERAVRRSTTARQRRPPAVRMGALPATACRRPR